MSTDTPLTEIESVLLKREVGRFNAKIAEAIKIIREAFDHYSTDVGIYGHKRINVSAGDLEKFHEYFSEMKVAYSSYSGGDYIVPSASIPATPPEFISKLLLKKAVEDFMAQVESVNDVAAMAERAMHAATA